MPKLGSLGFLLYPMGGRGRLGFPFHLVGGVWVAEIYVSSGGWHQGLQDFPGSAACSLGIRRFPVGGGGAGLQDFCFMWRRLRYPVGEVWVFELELFQWVGPNSPFQRLLGVRPGSLMGIGSCKTTTRRFVHI